MRGCDLIRGPFYRYGTHGKKYYFKANNKNSMESARKKALNQAKAVHANKK